MCLCVQIRNEKLFSSLIYIFLEDRSPHIQNSELRFDDTYCILIHVVDTDECKLPESNNCDESALCTNTAGSYVCRCNEGYTGNGTFCQGNYVKCGRIFLFWFLLKMNSFSRIFTNPSLPFYRCYILEGRCVRGDLFYVSM